MQCFDTPFRNRGGVGRHTQFATEAWTVWHVDGNYRRFFKMALGSTLLNGCAMHMHFDGIRLEAMRTMQVGVVLSPGLGGEHCRVVL